MRVNTKSAEYDCREAYNIEAISGNKSASLSFFDGEPEDNTIARNFNDIYGFDEIVKMAHEAGKRGEELVFTHEVDADWDEM